MPIFIKIFNSTADPAAFDKVMPEMMGYLGELKATGKLKASGPFGDFSGGVDIFEAENHEAALAIASKDPLVTHKLGTYTLKEWSDMIDQI
jgi:uncharacterized protein YciI